MAMLQGLEAGAIARAAAIGAGFVVVFTMAARGFTRSAWKAVLAGWLVSVGVFALGSGLAYWESVLAAIGFSLSAAALLVGWLAFRALLAQRRPGPTEPASAPRATVVTRHWRGEVAVGLALADIGVFVGAVVALGIPLAAAPTHRAPRMIGAAIVFAWVFVVAGTIWALVGAWRASRARNGVPMLLRWPVRALLMAGWGLLAIIATMEAAGSVSEYGRLAFGPSERRSYALTVLREGREVHLRGDLGYGATEDVKALLELHPGAKVLQLHSGGGRVIEGFDLAALVEERRLVTYVGRRCASACVIAFAGGRERWMGRSARFGLHRPTSPTGAPVWSTMREMADYLVGRGVSPDFVKRGLAQTRGMWEPSRGEVLAAGLATRLAGPDDVALPPLGEDELARIELDLRGERLFEMLYEFERPLFDRLASGLREGHRRGLTEQQAIGFLQAEIEKVLGRYLPLTSDRAAVSFFREIVRVGRSMEASDPHRCAAMLAGGAGEVPVGIPGRELLDAAAGVILDAQNHPGTALGSGAAGQATAVILLASLKLPLEVRQDLDAKELDRADPRRFCAAHVSFLEAILSQGEGSAGPALRYLAAEGGARDAPKPPTPGQPVRAASTRARPAAR